MYNPVMHENFVPAYQTSATPFVTASNINKDEVHQYTFNFVTRFFSVRNRGPVPTDSIAVSFTLNGFNSGNYFTLNEGEAFREEIKCVNLFVSGVNGSSVNYEIVAGLTAIPYSQFLTITGSNGFQGVG